MKNYLDIPKENKVRVLVAILMLAILAIFFGIAVLLVSWIIGIIIILASIISIIYGVTALERVLVTPVNFN
ncbi:MAG: hypothetical protein ACYCS1_05055 [Gammaproteobacteria bacterium]